jgi:hypothetical protein
MESMRFSVGLLDWITGERVSVSLATGRGVVTRRVTRKWLEKIQAAGETEVVQQDAREYFLVHVLDSDEGYLTRTWRVHEDLTAADVARYVDEDSKALFLIRTNADGRRRTFAFRRLAWEALRDQPWFGGRSSPAPAEMATSPGKESVELAFDPTRVGRLPLRLRFYLFLASMKVSFRARFAREQAESSNISATTLSEYRRPVLRFYFLAGGTIGFVTSLAQNESSFSLWTVGSGLLSGFNSAGIAGLLFAVISVSPRLYSTVRIHGRHIFKRTLVTLRLFRQSESAPPAGVWWIGIAAVCLTGILAYWLGLRAVIGAGALVLATGLGIAIAFLSPPAVLFLGASRPRTLSVLASLRNRLVCRVSALLDASTSLSAPIENFMSLDSFRATEHDNWRQLMASLKGTAVVSILDTAVPTEHVLFEAAETWRDGKLNEVLFLSDERGRFPVLEQLKDSGQLNLKDEVYVSEPEGLASATRILLWRKIYGPTLQWAPARRRVGAIVGGFPSTRIRREFLPFDAVSTHEGALGEVAFSESNHTFRRTEGAV